MKEVFEGLVKDTMDIYEDAIRHTDVVRLLKDLKIQKACADARVKIIGNELERVGVHDEQDDIELSYAQAEFERESKTFQYVIDVIESGKFAGE